jgi:hypothetical protein
VDLKEAWIVAEHRARHDNAVRPCALLGQRPPATEAFVPVFSRVLGGEDSLTIAAHYFVSVDRFDSEGIAGQGRIA